MMMQKYGLKVTVVFFSLKMVLYSVILVRDNGLSSFIFANMISGFSMMNFSLLDHIKRISPRPIMFIVGENAQSRYFSDDAYKMAAKSKQLVVIPNAGHVDLYEDIYINNR